MEFGREEGPFQAQHEAIVGVAWIVQAVFVSDERAEYGAQLNNSVPIAIEPRKARNFGDQHDADLAQADRGHEALKPLACCAARPGKAEVIVNNAGSRLWPTELCGRLHQLVLASQALLIVQDLLGGGLPHV